MAALEAPIQGYNNVRTLSRVLAQAETLLLQAPVPLVDFRELTLRREFRNLSGNAFRRDLLPI